MSESVDKSQLERERNYLCITFHGILDCHAGYPTMMLITSTSSSQQLNTRGLHTFARPDCEYFISVLSTSMKRTTICVIPANSEGFTQVFVQLHLVMQREWIRTAETEKKKKGEGLPQSQGREEISPESYENNDTRKIADRKK